MMRVEFKLRVPGHIAKYLVCDSVHAACGEVVDGLGFCFEETNGTNQGGWVVDFDDFEKLYKLAKALREMDSED